MSTSNKSELISQHYIDPTVTATAQEIASAVPEEQKLKVEIKPIHAVGNTRTKKELVEILSPRVNKSNTQEMEKEALKDQFLDEQTIKNVKEIAMKNPITKDLIEEAKKFTEQNKEEIKKQFNDLVAFYNIAHNRAFFYITSAEARMAIDYIKRCRDGFILDIKNEEQQDKYIYEFMKGISDAILNPKDIFNLNNINEKINGTEMSLCRIYNIKHPTRGQPQLSLTWINQMFSVLEAQNLIIDVMLMNSRRIADIRGFGQSVYDEYTKKEFAKRKVFGALWSAEIYPCNKLADNQVIFGALSHNIFLNAFM